MSGQVDDLSNEQEIALQKFKEAVKEFPKQPQTSDGYYLQWLRARKFNLEQAVEMYRKHLVFREEYDVDTVLEWTPPEVLRKYVPGSFFGEDRDGNPVFYDFFGNVDVKGVLKSSKPEDILRYKIQHAELTAKVLQECSVKKGRYIGNVTAIVNLENLSLQRQYYWPGVLLVKEMFQIYADNFPERTKAVFIINAPRIFPFMYNIVKSVMDEDTKKKLVIMGDNWKEELQKYISPDQLPQAYGGTACEPDPQCTDYVNWAGDVPETYYMTNLTETKREDMEKVTIGRGSSHQVEMEVESAGTIISWEFTSVDYDIGFGIFLKPSSEDGQTKRLHASEMTAVVQTKRKDSHIIPESGTYHCRNPGTYVLRFDNTYSWARSKEVYYAARLLTPDTEICDIDSLKDCNGTITEHSDLIGQTKCMSLEDPDFQQQQ